MAENLPEFKGQAQVLMPDSADNVASKISDFGNIIQNFTNKTTEYAGKQVGIKEKAQEMTLKTNIDNSMRAFARTSINLFDPQSGLSSFEQQAKDYTQQLTEGIGGQHRDAVRAYARNAMETNIKPLHAQVVKQAFNQARMQFLESIDSGMKDMSQGINQTTFEDLVNHHDKLAMPVQSKAKPVQGLIEAGNIDLTNRPQVKNPDGTISTVLSMGVEMDGKHYVLPRISETGVKLSEEEALELFQATGQHLGIFKTRKDADKFAQKLHESEAEKLANPEKARAAISPSVDAVQYNVSTMLQNIDGAIQTGLIKPDQGLKMKKKILAQANDEMLYHKYSLAVENGQGDKFIEQYAKQQTGAADAATFAKHIAAFKKIENLDLAQHAISESTAREFLQDNIKQLEIGNPTNAYADSIADRTPTLFPAYKTQRAIAELSGGLYKQFTAGTEQQALETYAHLQELNKSHDLPAQQSAMNESALDSAFSHAQTYFKELKEDPQKFLLENNLLGDIATQQKIDQKNPTFLPDDLKTPNSNTLQASIAWQGMHGIPSNKAQLLTNAQASEFGAQMLKAEPVDKVKMILGIQKQYGKYAPNVMQQLIKQGAVPREYGFFTALDPTSGVLTDVVDALTNTQLTYDSDQKAAVKQRVNKAMTVATDRAHPDVSTTRRILGFAFQQVKGAVTGREFDAAATNTGLFGTPALFDERGTTADIKLKALTESYLSASGYNTGTLVNTIDNTVNKLTNYYIKVRGLSQDDALAQATRAITSQYEMVDYRDNVIRMPKHKINYNDLSNVIANTPELINKVNWKFPELGDFGNPASRTDQINYFKQNIENGHWATDGTDQGLVWVNANGVVNKMENGNPLFISFESMQKLQRLKLNDKRIDFGTADAEAYVNRAFQLFKANNASFNQATFGTENSGNETVKQIPNSFSQFEKMSAVSVGRAKEFYNYLFADQQERQRKANAKMTFKGATKGVTL